MKTMLRHLILAPFALMIIVFYPLQKALDWAMGGPPLFGSLPDELRRFYRGDSR